MSAGHLYGFARTERTTDDSERGLAGGLGCRSSHGGARIGLLPGELQGAILLLHQEQVVST